MIHIRVGDVATHTNKYYGPLPVTYYRYLLERTKLTPIFIGELADRGTTVILTTHDLAGVEGIADRVGILQGSRLALDEDVEQLKVERGQSLEQIFTDVTRPAGRKS